ncbi:MAG: hypothetical protein WKF79_03295 [Nocardioides sp.]
MGDHLPETFEIVCTGPLGRPHHDDVYRHDEVLVYRREIHLQRGIMRANKKVFYFGSDDPKTFGSDDPRTFDRIDHTELRCPDPNCDLTKRWTDEDLSRLIGASCIKAAGVTGAERRAALHQELRGIDAILRSIR